MEKFYILGIDQSTQGTKGILSDEKGKIIGRFDLPHKQIINEQGWISHNPEELFRNSMEVCRRVIEKTGIDKSKIRCMGITNQRETTIAWERSTGKPLADAVVWQCNRASKICENIETKTRCSEAIYRKTGLILSPYYPASKMAWLIQNNEAVRAAKKRNDLAMGTVDSFLIYRFTNGQSFRTDYSNASRTQLFNLNTLAWDEEICNLFGIPEEVLPEVTDSDGVFGETNLEGFLDTPIPICGVLGDSHGALFAHNCRKPGGVKTTYGTGSSIMMNIGDKFKKSNYGLSTSLAWKIGGKCSYVLEGNINYTGAVISWLKNDLNLISSVEEVDILARQAKKEDKTYLIPAFSGLGAPWWNNSARAMIYGMSRSTGKSELVKAACESSAYQIRDVVEAMRKDTGFPIKELCVDGGPTRNAYLMQFQSDITEVSVKIPDAEELSVLGVIFLAGISAGFWKCDEVYQAISYKYYEPEMSEELRETKIKGWKEGVEKLL